jgi:predicted transcriptional regulator
MAVNLRPEVRADLAAQCYEMRLKGMSLRQIAKEIGISHTAVNRSIAHYIEKRVAPGAEEYRKLLIDRLEDMYFRIYPGIEKGDLATINTARSIVADLYKFNGLEVVKMEHTITEVTQEDLEIMELIKMEKGKGIIAARTLTKEANEDLI